MLELVAPDATRREEFLEARREWGPGQHEDGFGIAADDDLESAAGFTSWIDRLRSGSGRLWWIVDGSAVLGGIALRADGDPRVETLGHVGYGIRPSARGRGVASWALAQVLARARASGAREVVAVCRIDNLASIRTVEKCGGRRGCTARLGGSLVQHFIFELG
jgi:predicted acetyltransferase